MRSMTYNGALTREQFLFYEIRIAARFFMQGVTLDDAIQTITAQNLFQFPTEREVRSIARACYRRLGALENDTLVCELAEAPTEIAKQINLYAIMRDNRLVWDFMVDFIGEKYRNLDLILTRPELNVFMTELQTRDEKAATWSESTIKKIRGVLVRILVETGYLDNHRDTTLKPVYLHDELRQRIKANGDDSALCAFNCFE